MLTTLLGNDAVSSWMTAHILAVLLIYPLMRTRRLNALVGRLARLLPGSLLHRHARRLTFLFIVAILGAALTTLMNLQPVQAGMTAASTRLSANQSPWREQYNLLDDLLVAFEILVLLAFIPIINTMFVKIARSVDTRWKSRFRALKIQNLELITPGQMTDLLRLLVKYVRFALIALILSVCLTLVFSLYPVTQGLTQAILSRVLEGLNTLWEGFLSFLPNLITLVIIIILARFSLKVLHFFYLGLQRGKINLSAIHPELAEPTYQLLRFLVVAFALVAAFPYIPGSSSPVFKGLSILVGFLLSLGSTSLVTNIVSGIVLTYTRGLKIGDRVLIAGTTGDVVDRTLLVTRICTIKNVIVTIPNGMVLQNQIVNYSAASDEQGLILHTSVTIGYDVPWRQVQQLLIDAALQTADILAAPPPFVFKTSLDDFYITYELNAYTQAPSQMAVIYSELHQNILDQFNHAGVEIMSPSYFAVRDGQTVTVPEQVHYTGTGNGHERAYRDRSPRLERHES